MKDHVCKNRLKRSLFRLKNDHELVKKFLFPGARVFDFGCGDGKFFDRIKDIQNLKLVGFDVNKQALEIARSKGYEVYDSLDKIKGPFDFITANEVVEHLKVNTELPEFFRKAEEFLSENGKLIVSTTNLNEFYSLIDFWHDPTHIRPLTIESLERLGTEAKLEVNKVIKHHMRINPRKIIVNLLLGLDLYGGYTVIFKKQNL
jgi:cyclopropane fatty-acyl-phospholipid synthase-like methyltransferase